MPSARTPHLAVLCAALPLAALAGCFSNSSGGGGTFDDSGTDGAAFDDGGADSTFAEASFDSGTDATVDAAPDTFVPPVDSGHEAAVDAAHDAPAEAMVDAMADASPEAGSVVGAVYVNPTTGADTNPGTMGAPLKTVAAAEALVNGPDGGAGWTVYLGPGTYDSTNQTQLWGTFNSPTNVVGASSATVTLSGTYAGEALYFAKGGSLSGVTFHDTSTAFQVQGGTFTTNDVVFDGLPGFNNTPMSFINGAVATLNTTSITNLNANAGGQDWACIYVDNTANVTWHATGNTITGTSQHGNCIFARGAAQLAVDGLAMMNFQGFGAQMYDQASVTLSNATWTNVGPTNAVCSATGCRAAIWMGGSQAGVPTGTLDLEGMTITGGPASAVSYTTTTNTGAVSLTLNNSHLDSNAYDGVWIAGPSSTGLSIQLSATNTTFSHDGIAGLAVQSPASVSLSGCTIDNDGAGAAVGSLGQIPGGLLMQASSGVNALKMRGGAFASDTGNLVAVLGVAGTTVDMGTTASPGGTTFAGVPIGAGVAALDLQAPIAATAVGNTWIPTAQGADANGHYTTATTITGPANGPNVLLPTGASVVMQ